MGRKKRRTGADPALRAWIRRTEAESRAKSLDWGRNCFRNALKGLESFQNLSEPSSESERADYERIREAVELTKRNPKFPPIDVSVARTIQGLALLNHLNSIIQRFHGNVRLAGQGISIEEITNG